MNRDVYVVGKIGSYLAPTVPACDAQLRLLVIRLRDGSAKPWLRQRMLADCDALLDRRAELMPTARETAA